MSVESWMRVFDSEVYAKPEFVNVVQRMPETWATF
jgi:hypothetical protein